MSRIPIKTSSYTTQVKKSSIKKRSIKKKRGSHTKTVPLTPVEIEITNDKVPPSKLPVRFESYHQRGSFYFTPISVSRSVRSRNNTLLTEERIRILSRLSKARGSCMLPTLRGSTLRINPNYSFPNEHSCEFKANEEATFKRYTDKSGLVATSSLGIMLRSLGFYPNREQLRDIIGNQENINFKKFQEIVLDIENVVVKIEQKAAKLFVQAADWKKSGKITISKLKDICCNFGDKKFDVEEWKEFMRLVNPKQNEIIDYMEIISILILEANNS